MTDEERDAYFDGGRAAARAMLAARLPIACPWEQLAPDYVRQPTFRAYQWKRGFAFIWDRVRVNRGWPDWTEMRLILTPPKDTGAKDDDPQ